MNYKWDSIACLCAQRTAWFGVFLLLGVSGLQAQTIHIGNAPVVRNDVEGTLSTGVVTVHIGDSVFRDEDMRTGPDSEARLVFLDDTNVSLGPNSSLKLDQFVYADQKAKAVAVNVTKGLLRFVTGKGDKNVYKINTPVATIGVRGTVFDVVADGSHTTVTLLEGEVLVCQQNSRHCATLNHPNQQAKVTSSGITKSTGPSPFQAATGCRGGLCDTSNYVAALQNNSLPPKLPLFTSPLPAPPSVRPPVPPNAVGQNDSGSPTQFPQFAVGQNNSVPPTPFPTFPTVGQNNTAPPTQFPTFPASNFPNNGQAVLAGLILGSTVFPTSRLSGGGLTIGNRCSISPTAPGVGACNSP